MTDSSKTQPTMKKSIFFSLFISSFLLVINTTLTLMAGIYIVGDLGGSSFIATYSVSFFAVANALGIPLGKHLIDSIGTAKSFFICMLLFAFFSLLCALAPNYPTLVILRFLQGFVCGPFVYQISRLLPKGTIITSTMLTIAIVCPVLGVSLGGIVAYEYHWRWLFYFDVIVAIILALIFRGELKREENNPRAPFDVWGYLFLFLGVLSICTVLIMGQELDWFRSTLVITLTIVGVISLFFTVLRSWYHPYPILNFRLFTRPFFSFFIFTLGVLFSAYFGMVILLVFWLSLYVNFTPLWIGLLIGTMAIAGFLPNFLIQEKIGCNRRFPLAIAIVLLLISCFHTTIFNVDVDFGRIAYSRILAGFGLALFMPPLYQMSFDSFAKKRSVQVLELFNMTRTIGCGLGASLYTILWQRRLYFYYDRLGGALTDFSAQTSLFLSKATDAGFNGLKADAKLDYYLQRQSIALALDDVFYLMGWILVGLLVLTLLTFLSRNPVFFPKSRSIRK